MKNTNSRRIIFLDAARGLAVIVALFSHGMIIFRVWKQWDKDFNPIFGLVLRDLMHFATPSFIVLFGIMLEIVYYNKIQKIGEKAVRYRLLQRSLICYLGYCSALVIGTLKGTLSIHESLAASVFLGDGHFNNVIKFWVIALILAIPLMNFRLRFGLNLTVCAGLSLWLLVPFLDHFSWPHVSHPLAHLSAFLFGRPMGLSQISFLHSLALIVLGMLLGRTLLIGMKAQHFRLFYKTLGCLIIASVVVIIGLAIHISPMQVLICYDNIFRELHHIGYYVIGLTQALIGLLCLSWLFPLNKQYDPKFSLLVIFGRFSLFSFVLGNIFLEFVLKEIPITIFTAILYSFLLIGFLGVILIILERWLQFRQERIECLPESIDTNLNS